MRLLIAEDEPEMARLLLRALGAEGYTVDGVQNGQEAWEKIRGTAYDAAVLDIMMPGLDGLTLLGRMRQAGIAIPVLLLTAKDAVEDRVAGLNTGADGSVLTREQLLGAAWNADYSGNSNVVDVYIRYLRSKIDDPFERKLLHTVRGVGYALREQG